MRITPETIARYLSIETRGGGDYHPSKPEIAYISNRSGAFQVYVRDLVTGDEVQVSDGEDRATNPVYLKSGDLVFSSDTGGDENFQFYFFDGERVERLTTTDDAKHNFEFATEDAIYFSSNLEDRGRFDVYRFALPLKPGSKPEKLMQGRVGNPLRPQICNEQGTTLVVSVVAGNLKNDLLLYDLDTGIVEAVTERIFGDHNARFYPVELLDSDRMLVRTDFEREFLSLAILDMGLGELTWLEPDEYDTGRAVHFDLNRLLFTRNVDGADQLWTAELLGDELVGATQLPLPDRFSVLMSGDFRSFTRSFVVHPDNDRALFTYSAPTSPSNVTELDLRTHSLTTLVEPVAFDGPAFVDESLERFRSFDDLLVPYFMAAPAGDGPYPTLLLIHGGPEGQTRPSFSNVVQMFVAAGYVVVAPNIRGSSGYGRTYLALDDVEKRLDSIRDINALADHLGETNSKVDSGRLIVYGGSYGGFAVLSSITEYPARFAAAVDVVGISNFVTFLEQTAPWRRRLREVEYGSLEDNRAFLESISPIHKVADIQTPLLIVQGRNDERVPIGESVQMHAALEARNVPCELLVFDDEGHGVVKRTNQIVQFEKMFAFLDEHLPV